MKQIYKVLNQLPDNQKNCIFTLSKMDGFNNLEIANYEYTIIAVESLVYRAKESCC
jgi:DNA-directed RNA polymerase specialized sigma24 family protein